MLRFVLSFVFYSTAETGDCSWGAPCSVGTCLASFGLNVERLSQSRNFRIFMCDSILAKNQRCELSIRSMGNPLYHFLSKMQSVTSLLPVEGMDRAEFSHEYHQSGQDTVKGRYNFLPSKLTRPSNDGG